MDIQLELTLHIVLRLRAIFHHQEMYSKSTI